MSNHSLRSVIKAHTLMLLFFFACGIAAAQSPSPTPVNPATRPPGEQTQLPTAPPATQQPTPQTPPGAEAFPAPSPTPVQPSVQEPREPNFPQVQPKLSRRCPT